MPDERLIERILVAVECVPPGRVASYGDIADLVGCGPRQVGAVLRDHGGGVPWWRVTNAAGAMHSPADALPRWLDEGIPLRPDGRGCRMAQARADLVALASMVDAANLNQPSRLLGSTPRVDGAPTNVVEPSEFTPGGVGDGASS